MTMTHLIQRNSLNKESKERVIKTKKQRFHRLLWGKARKEVGEHGGLGYVGLNMDGGQPRSNMVILHYKA